MSLISLALTALTDRREGRGGRGAGPRARPRDAGVRGNNAAPLFPLPLAASGGELG